MLKTLLIVFTLFLFNQNILAQTNNFFPISIGNEYQFLGRCSQNYFFGTIERDTLYANGELYISLPYDLYSFGDTRVDEKGNVLSISKPFFIASDPEEYLLFKADAQLDEVWAVAWNYNVVIDTGYARCIFDDSLYVFGELRRVKGILIFDESYYYYFFWLAEGIGLIRDQFDDGCGKDLNYAQINGVEYGKIVSVDEIPQLPAEFNVSQNYPNPFNPETHIDFMLMERSNVRLTVFNILGQEIKTLVNEELIPGYYSRVFDGKDLPSGIYFYELVTDKIRITKKMILLR